MWTAVLIVLSGILFYWYKSSFSYWNERNVPHLKPHFLWGNLKDAIYQKLPIFQVYSQIYRKFPNEPYVGVYIVRRPGILIRDPDLVKDILVKDFSSFQDNDRFVDEKHDVIFGSNPASSKGEKWKARRIIHTGKFSSAKIKHMYTLLDQGGNRMIKFIDDNLKNNGRCSIDTMELAAKYTVYNICNITMGVDPKTFEDDNAEMREMGRKIIQPNFWNIVKALFIFIFPHISQFLAIPLIPKDVTEKFRKMVKENLLYRQENAIVRNDFFEEIQKYKSQQSSLDEMVIQIGGFFLDGHATNSAFLTLLLYELALHPAVQEILKEELVKYLQNGEISLEDLEQMPYLDAVVCEGLRKYAPLATLSKACTKEYTLPPRNDSAKPLKIEPGTPVIISMIALHNDEKYFPDPERFDATRFLGDNKKNITRFAYIPFNEGPRTCLGKRFALLQSKVMISKLVLNFKLKLNKKTKTPIEYESQSFLVAARGSIWIDIER